MSYHPLRLRRKAALLAAPALALSLLAAATSSDPSAKTLAVGNQKLSLYVTDIGDRPLAFDVRDLEGQLIRLSDLKQRRATVFLFLGTECPISNGYTPRILSLSKAYEPKDVRVIAVYANRNETREQILQHARSRNFPFTIVRDDSGELTRTLGARVTPHAVVLDSSGAIRYRGRIDDSKQGDKITRADLKEALNALLAGKKVARPETVAFGCSIAVSLGVLDSIGGSPTPAAITYAKHVAPILQKNCQSCHRPGEVGPMSLMTYEQASAFAPGIKAAVQRRSMPPWPAEDGYGEFLHSRRLSEEEIKTLSAWVDAGSPLGNPNDMPPPVQFPEGWQLGAPDRIYESPEPYALAADGADVYRNFVLEAGFDEDRYITAMEVRPDQKQVVHHVIAYIDARPQGKGRSLELDAKDPGPGYTSSGAGVNFDPDGMLGGWAPGNESRHLPDGVAIKLPKGSHIVLQVHYHKNGVAVKDRTRIGLHFAKTPVKKLTVPYPIAKGDLEIPPGEKNHRATAEMTAPTNVHAVSIMPHMHQLGRRMKVTATRPDGTIVPMVHVPAWDFRWQNTYTYKEPVALPKGTKVLVEAWYDNSADNPNNPNSPLKTVRWGEATTDEMLLAYVWITVDAENLNIEPAAL